MTRPRPAVTWAAVLLPGTRFPLPGSVNHRASRWLAFPARGGMLHCALKRCDPRRPPTLLAIYAFFPHGPHHVKTWV